MVKQRKHSNSRASDFSDYLGGGLRGKDRNAFERRLQKDPFEAEAAEGLGLVSREEMEEDLRTAALKIRRRISRKRRIAWYSAAAAIASLMIVATIFFTVDDGNMDRYLTAPEFEEAAKEKPDAPSMIKKETRKDVIPDAADGKAADILQGAGKEEEPVTGAGTEDESLPGTDPEEDRVQAKVQEEEPLLKEVADDTEVRELNLQDQAMKATRQDAAQSRLKQDTEDHSQATARAEEKGGTETIRAEGYEDEITQQLQGQFAGINVTQNLQGEVSGIVYSADDLEPLPGVTLFIKGSTAGTVSGVDGRFSLKKADVSGSTLVATYIGMQTEEIPLDYSQPMEIAMVPDAVQLDEVVVVGQTSSAKTMLTGAVTKVEPEPGAATEYTSASPVAGIIDYKQYIDSTLTYPADTASGNREVVVLKFSVTPGGRPYDFEEVRSPGAPFTREAIRVITEGPDWIPTTRDGIYVDDQVRLRIVFRPASQ